MKFSFFQNVTQIETICYTLLAQNQILLMIFFVFVCVCVCVCVCVWRSEWKLLAQEEGEKERVCVYLSCQEKQSRNHFIRFQIVQKKDIWIHILLAAVQSIFNLLAIHSSSIARNPNLHRK